MMKEDETYRKRQALRFPSHSCELSPAPDRIYPQLPPNATLLQRTQRFLQHQLVGWRRSLPLRLIRPSNLQFELEQARHVRSRYWWVIHPMSRFYMIWQAIVVCAIIIYLCTWPVLYSWTSIMFTVGVQDYMDLAPQWDPNPPSRAEYAEYAATAKRLVDTINVFNVIDDTIFWMHILIKFNTGYLESKTNRVIMVPSRIVVQYLRTSAIIDILAGIAYFEEGRNRIIYSNIYTSQLTNSGGNAYLWLTTIFCIAKLLRLYELYACLHNWFQFLNITRIWKIIAFLIFAYCIFVHWMACLSYYLPFLVNGKNLFSKTSSSWLNDRSLYMLYPNTSIGLQYLTALHRVVRITRGSVNKQTGIDTTPEDGWLIILTLYVGQIFTFLLMTVTIEVVETRARGEIKLPQVMDEVKNYMRQRQLPVHLRQKMLLFYAYTLKGRYVRERAIFASLPASIRDTIRVACCHRMLAGSPLFRNVPKSLVLSVVGCLREELYLPNDVIYTFRSEPKAMYFLSTGTVMIVSPSGEEMGHLDDGAFFGEMELVSDWKRRVLSVVALEVTEVYELPRKDFRRLFKASPRLYNRLRTIAMQRTNELSEMDDTIRRYDALSNEEDADEEDAEDEDRPYYQSHRRFED